MGKHYRTLLLLLVHLVAAASAESFALQRTAPNLHPNPTLTSAAGWVGSGAVWSPVSRTAGSGSLALTQYHLTLGPVIPITPGQTYTCGAWIRGTHAPTDFVRLSLALYNASGTHLRNSPGASDWGYAVPGQWQETVVVHHALGDEHMARILLSRDIALAGTVPVNVDDVYCGGGVSFAQAPSPKEAFWGGITRVDAAGNVAIKQASGLWKPEFLRCMFTTATEDWRTYATGGWNCNMWASALSAVKRGVDAGMPYAFFQLGQYIQPGAWAYGRLDWLKRDLGAILASPYAPHLIGYYYDNESPAQFVLATQVMSLVDSLDRLGGVRQRPIYILQGNWGRAVAYGAYGDITGTYQRGEDLPLRVLAHIHGQTQPVVFGQIQQESGKTLSRMRSQILSIFGAGAHAIGYWHTRPIVQELWYLGFPGLAREFSP